MNDNKDNKAAAEPPLDCRVRLREAVNEVMRHQFTHSAEAMSALQRLVDAAEAGACEIDRLRNELKPWQDFGRAVAEAGGVGVQFPLATVPNA